MPSHSEQLEQARQRVLETRRVAEAQRERVDRLSRQGQETSEAKSLLHSYERTVAIFEDDFVRLSKELNPSLRLV